MEITEMIGWVLLGFVPTLGGMELAWRKSWANSKKNKLMDKAKDLGEIRKISTKVV
jgi:hypothetical protein